jgi:cation diffusion facilitator CzcD-associated flavoprotein CzcO
MAKDSATDNNLISGDTIFKYLDRYAEDNNIKSLIRFNSWVSSVERCPRGWRLVVNGATIETAKLIIATGVTSVRNSPSFTVHDDAVPVIHSMDIARSFPTFCTQDAQHFVLIGAAKSAYDAAYMLCKMGKKVTWYVLRCFTVPSTYLHKYPGSRASLPSRSNTRQGYPTRWFRTDAHHADQASWWGKLSHPFNLKPSLRRYPLPRN